MQPMPPYPAPPCPSRLLLQARQQGCPHCRALLCWRLHPAGQWGAAVLHWRQADSGAGAEGLETRLTGCAAVIR